ncbi:hypothetical protein J4G08_13010, partial [Candidatus Poribacteria bacterium]|nr:hypothetical protein [Candidatus Poribacteria bacterium]
HWNISKMPQKITKLTPMGFARSTRPTPHPQTKQMKLNFTKTKIVQTIVRILTKQVKFFLPFFRKYYIISKNLNVPKYPVFAFTGLLNVNLQYFNYMHPLDTVSESLKKII